MFKRKGILIFIAIYFSIFVGSVFATTIEHEKYANALNEMGLFKGSSKGFELDRAPNRLESGVMLIRLLGKEEEALKMNLRHPFTDVPEWGNPYVGFLYQNQLTQGIGDQKFGSAQLIDSKSYITFVLRALGYDDKRGDFTWNLALEKGKEVGLVSKEFTQNPTFTRGDMVYISYNALNTLLNNKQHTLKDKLIMEGVIKDEGNTSIENVSSATVKVTLSGFSSEGFGSHMMKIDRQGLPEGLRHFHRILVRGTDSREATRDIDIYIMMSDSFQQEIVKRRLEYEPVYDDKLGVRTTVYSNTRIILFDKNNKFIGYGSFIGYVREGVVNVEFRQLGEYVFQFEEITSGVWINDEAKLMINRQQLPRKMANFSYITVGTSRSNLSEMEIERMAYNLRSRRVNYKDEGINLLEIPNIWSSRLIVYLYDSKDNVLGYGIYSTERIINRISRIEEVKNARKVTSGLIFNFDEGRNILTTIILNDELPSFVRDFFRFRVLGVCKESSNESVLYWIMFHSDMIDHEYSSATGFTSRVDFDRLKYYALFFDTERKLLGYFPISDKDINNGRLLLKDINIQLETEYSGNLIARDFMIRKFVNGVEDTNFKWSGGTSSTTMDSQGRVTSVIIKNLLYYSGVEYKVTPLREEIKIKSYTLE